MKFIEFISVVRAIYLVVIFVIAGCCNGNSYRSPPTPSTDPPPPRPPLVMVRCDGAHVDMLQAVASSIAIDNSNQILLGNPRKSKIGQILILSL